MSRLTRNIISILYSIIRFSILKVFQRERFSFKGIQRFSPYTQLFFLNKGEIHLGKKVRMHSFSKLRAINNGILIIGDNTSINYNCMFVCLKSIKIGKGVEFGPNVLIYDHDHDFRDMEGLKAQKYKYGEVSIGDNTWVGANTIILRDTHIGRNCVVAAGCVIKGIYPENSIIIQKRDTIIKSICT